MSTELYSVEQVAEQLHLHVKTVRSYVREGRLKATRIGKQYRIAAEDFAAFAGRPVAPATRDTIGRRRQIDTSTIVQIDVIDADAASRLSNALVAIANSRRPGDEPLNVNAVYYEETARLKIIVSGSLANCAYVLEFIRMHMERSR